ncbi:hypothetical protein TNCV_2743451 [Trichonephila clavipes]|nr:hypothetical protein TNCV_2743451 [Trichonephila clavipes]
MERQLGANLLVRLCAHAPSPAVVDGLPTFVTVAQRAINCLEEAVRSFTTISSRCQLFALTSPPVVHYQFFELLGARRSPASKLASLWNCSAEH